MPSTNPKLGTRVDNETFKAFTAICKARSTTHYAELKKIIEQYVANYDR